MNEADKGSLSDTTRPVPAPRDSLRQRLMSPPDRLLWVAVVALLVVAAVWAYFTPSGLLGRADAIGYAVCHRIAVRSFAFPDGRQLPMCARCSGTFLGVLIGLLGPGLILRRRRAGLFPPPAVIAVLIGFSLFWAFDGANSFVHLLPPALPRLYTPANSLRLLTGMLHGITMGSLLLPVLNAVLWADVTPERTIENAGHLLVLMGIGGIVIGMILSGLAVFLYPLALLSAVGVLSILGTVCTVLLTTLLGYENKARSLREALPLLLLGLTLALIMIGGVDALRFAMFKTWEGFVFPSA